MNKTKNRNILISKYPASWHNDMWREATPLGNGEVGGLVYGGIWKEIIMLSHAKLWHAGKTPKMPDVSDSLPTIRKYLTDNDPISAERVMADAMASKGYFPVNSYPLPVCDICVTMNKQKPFKKYRRKLDMETGEVTVSWNEDDSTYNRKLFISRENDLICYEITVCGEDEMDVDICLSLHDTETLGNLNIPTNIQAVAKKNIIKYAATKDNNSDFGSVAWIDTDGDITVCKNFLNVKNAKNVTLFAKVFIESNRKEQWEKIEREFENNKFVYEDCLQKHIKIHSTLFNATQFNLFGTQYEKANEELLLEAYEGESSSELLSKLWSFGRYLLISASKEGGYPCQLYGLWCGDYQPMWAINMLNENLQMIYWQALTGNMPKLLMAVFDYVESKIDDYRENARKLYGCRGINIPAFSTPESGLHKCIYPHLLHWTVGAGWICQHYYDYYQFTDDKEFLKNRAMPFMYETILFFEDFLTIDKNEFYISSPSNSPENIPKNLLKFRNDKYWCEVTVNATMDFAIIKELLTNLIEGAKITGRYYDNIEKWEKMLLRIPKYQINKDGTIREWMHDFYEDNYEHRHLSHIYPVFPGIEITKGSDKDLYNAFFTAVRKRLLVGLKNQTGWSLAHMANVYARMGDGELSIKCLDLLAQTNILNNFFTVCNDWRRMGIAVCDDLRKAPVQLDAIMGLSAAVQEMLLFSVKDKIYILPALPKRWNKGEVKGLLARGNISVDILWDMDKKQIRVFLIACNEDKKITVVFPKDYVVEVDLKKNIKEEIKYL